MRSLLFVIWKIHRNFPYKKPSADPVTAKGASCAVPPWFLTHRFSGCLSGRRMCDRSKIHLPPPAVGYPFKSDPLTGIGREHLLSCLPKNCNAPSIQHSGSEATFHNPSPKQPSSLRLLSLAAVKSVLLFVITCKF